MSKTVQNTHYHKVKDEILQISFSYKYVALSHAIHLAL